MIKVNRTLNTSRTNNMKPDIISHHFTAAAAKAHNKFV
jgi:hypothetical protein